jgi:hypothetical protein
MRRRDPERIHEAHKAAHVARLGDPPLVPRRRHTGPSQPDVDHPIRLANEQGDGTSGQPGQSESEGAVVGLGATLQDDPAVAGRGRQRRRA